MANNDDTIIIAFIKNDLSDMDQILKNEEKINEMTEIITSFLVELSGSDLNVNEFSRIGDTYHVINDIERMGDHAENILELAQERNRKGTDITEEGAKELETIYHYADEAMKLAYESYRDNDIEKALSVGDVEDKIDKLQKQYRDAHIRRLNKGQCSALAGIHFLDLISNLERVGDHAKNIADTVAEIDEEIIHLKNA